MNALSIHASACAAGFRTQTAEAASDPAGTYIEYTTYVNEPTRLAIQLSLGNCTTPNTFFLSDVRVEQAGKIDLVSDTIYTF